MLVFFVLDDHFFDPLREFLLFYVICRISLPKPSMLDRNRDVPICSACDLVLPFCLCSASLGVN